MKYIVVFLIFIVDLCAFKTADPAKYGRSHAYIDTSTACCLPHRALPRYANTRFSNLPRNGMPLCPYLVTVLIDSSGNGFSANTKMQECIAFNPEVGGVQFVNRGYSPTGVLNVHQTDTAFSFWVDDSAVYNQQIPPANGGARYPTSVAANSEGVPLISFPTLDAGPILGYAVAQYEVGGWYSSLWDEPVDLLGNVGAMRVIGKQLPNGDILYIIVTIDGGILYCSGYGSGVLATDVNYLGYDINGGIACVFYYDDSLNIYYRTTTDGTTWNSEDTYDIVWPTPYANSAFYSGQMALTDSGKPILVLDIIDDDDATYPWNGIVYVSTEEGQPCIPVSQTHGQAFYGTIATGGSNALVLYQFPYNDLEDSLAGHDQWYNFSTNNGVTWYGPFQLTSSDQPTGLGQVAKRIKKHNRWHSFYFFCGVDMIEPHDPFWHVNFDDYGTDPHAWYANGFLGAVEEDNQRNVVSRVMLIEICPNPFSKLTMIKLTGQSAEGMGQSAKGKELQIYDAGGRIVKDFNLQSQISNPQCILWSGTDNNDMPLPAGVYFVRCETEEKLLVEKVVKLK